MEGEEGRINFLDYLFPPRCVGCRLFCKNILCTTCAAKLIGQNARQFFIADCKMQSAVSFSEGVVERAIYALKYEHIPDVAAVCAQLVAPLLNEIGGRTHFVPVPLHPRRRRERGYNQAELIIQALGKTPDPVLARIRYTTPQAKSNKAVRESQLIGAFKIITPINSADNYILVDDVLTTGATLTACANEIRRAGARRISAVTVAAA